MPEFVSKMVDTYQPGDKAEDVVNIFREFYQSQEQKAKQKGLIRKSSWIASAQSALSKYKSKVNAPPEFKKDIHLSREEMIVCNNEKSNTLRDHSIDIKTIHGDEVVLDCRKLLKSKDVCLKIIAVACLSGRRMTEIISSVEFGPPAEKHFTNLKYWSCVTGLLKQRGDNKCFDVPLFEERDKIIEAVKEIREQTQHITKENVNKLMAKKISSAMHKYAPQIGKIHNFRKFYALMAFQYFNDRNCSLPRVASDCLGHKSLDESILTYLNFKVDNTGSLKFT